MDKKPSILLADDHTMVAEALAIYLREQYALAGIVSDGAALLSTIKRLRPDVAVIDMSMPVMNGLDCLRQLRADGNKTNVIVLTMHKDPELASETLRAGARGYILKHSAGEELTTAIQEVLEGRIYLSKAIAAEVMSAMYSPGPHAFSKLTPRQREVLKLVAAGRTMKEVAAALHLSRRTVETHKYEMMHVLGVATTAELIEYAIRHEELGHSAGLHGRSA